MLNKVMLIGHLGADPETRYMPNGDPVVTLNLATTRKWKDKSTNERKEETEWHRITFFSGLAKIAGEYLKKGSKIYVEGRIKTQKWQKDGVDQYSTGIVGESLKMLDGKGDSQQAAPAQNAEQAPQSAGSDDFYNDDIPF